MDPATLRRGKHGTSLRSVKSSDLPALDDKTAPPGAEPAALSATAQSVIAASEPGLSGGTSRPGRAHLACSLLKAAMDDAAQAAELNHMRRASEWAGLHAQTIASIHAGALSAIELMEALGVAQGPRDFAAAHIIYGHRQRESLAGQIMEYLAAARNIMSVLAATPFGHDVGCTKEAGCAHAPCTTRIVIDRLRALTERQKSVLELVAQGLPNKVIAYELRLSETTIKAHVSGILRKLCVYSRARAIVLLANIDLASIGEAELREEPDRPRHIG